MLSHSAMFCETHTLTGWAVHPHQWSEQRRCVASGGHCTGQRAGQERSSESGNTRTLAAHDLNASMFRRQFLFLLVDRRLYRRGSTYEERPLYLLTIFWRTASPGEHRTKRSEEVAVAITAAATSAWDGRFPTAAADFASCQAAVVGLGYRAPRGCVSGPGIATSEGPRMHRKGRA